MFEPIFSLVDCEIPEFSVSHYSPVVVGSQEKLKKKVPLGTVSSGPNQHTSVVTSRAWDGEKGVAAVFFPCRRRGAVLLPTTGFPGEKPLTALGCARTASTG